MTLTQWLSGPNGQLLSSSAVIVILILMLFMSVRLYVSYRNKRIYRLLITAIPIIIIKQCLLVVLAYPGWSLSPFLHLAFTILQILSFIIINFVFMKLYTHRTAQLKVIPFIIMSMMTFVIAGIQFAIMPNSMDTVVHAQAFTYPALDFYGLIVIFMIMLDTRSAHMSSKYYASLIVFFASELARLSNAYVFHGSLTWLLTISQLLPIVYYTLLFILLFEWVIERLMFTYQSSIMDGLTGLYNRRHFSSKAEQLLQSNKPMAIIFCDIDNFKKLNDTHGHHKADGVLKQVSEIIKEESSGIGSAGRYGGEELLSCISTERVKPEIVAESIRRRVEQETMVTISVGFSTSKESKVVQEMIKQADEAMYYSKTTGKNKVTPFKSSAASKKSKA
ncbi:GGDEF domain-containing protein [Paenibacillus sp. FSL A5-0031]|uniref:GGDEF domain-containing protein n=1 Tax=Paenibacillus sp. FSL A5-0031 TaxID=1920420 RepID=UPI00096DB75F|nr:GGDEF domain-containing protein [Paenibacillus sp. FSL A5-0031]OME78249.1 GGDEF domain-containing protein [Paenibacillus sp. FSL A5-0031]